MLLQPQGVDLAWLCSEHCHRYLVGGVGGSLICIDATTERDRCAVQSR